jgi:hypothetical protein
MGTAYCIDPRAVLLLKLAVLLGFAGLLAFGWVASRVL